MPRVADFMPYLLPPQAADALLAGLANGVEILDIPGYLWIVYALFGVAPGLTRRMLRPGGARREYGGMDWYRA